MPRRVCLITVSNDFVPEFTTLLPKDVAIAQTQECFDRAATILRLEGAGLPEWCEEPAGGQPYIWCSAEVPLGQQMRFVRGVEIPASARSITVWEKLEEQHNQRN